MMQMVIESFALGDRIREEVVVDRGHEDDQPTEGANAGAGERNGGKQQSMERTAASPSAAGKEGDGPQTRCRERAWRR